MKRTLGPAAGVALLQAIGLQAALADAGYERFVASGYVYCDAVILGAYWGQSAQQAKALVGRKLGWGNENIVRTNLNAARAQGHRCSFQDTGFSYADAQALAGFWGISVEDAKAELAEKVSTGLGPNAHEILVEARRSPVSAPAEDEVEEDDESENFDRWVASEYEYCDAVILGAFWGESVDEAKITIGRKLGFGNDSIIKANRRDARRQGERCAFDDTGFSYEDAEALATMWDVGVDDAKAALAEKVSMGRRALADQVVAEANGG